MLNLRSTQFADRFAAETIRAKLATATLPLESERFRLPGREHINREAAVLIAICGSDADCAIILTQRPDTMPDHPGQIALPGGKRDPSDPSPEATALREAKEEVGVDVAPECIVGTLPIYEVATGYRITPVIARISDRPPLFPHPREVAAAFYLPAYHLLDSRAYQHKSRDVQIGIRRPFFYETRCDGRTIWGATAAILRNLALVLETP